MRTSWTLRVLSTLFHILALASIAVLLYSDTVHRLHFTAAHQHTAAFPLLFIGLSYVSLQLSARRDPSEMVKGLLLGLAFVLWGGEQLMPPSSVVTVMDTAVVSIFVIDLGLIIVEHLKRRDHETP